MSQAIRLYRQLWRLCNRFPEKKVRYIMKQNVRDAFEIYRNAEGCKAKQALDNAKKVVIILENVETLDSKVFPEIFGKGRKWGKE